MYPPQINRSDFPFAIAVTDETSAVDKDAVTTVQEMLTRVNDTLDDALGAGKVVMSINADGNGFVLTDTTGGAQTLRVLGTGPNADTTAKNLGIGVDFVIPGITTVTGKVPNADTPAQRVENGIGQGTVTVSPFGLAVAEAEARQVVADNDATAQVTSVIDGADLAVTVAVKVPHLVPFFPDTASRSRREPIERFVPEGAP